ncbi:TRAP transporter fused permease subunit [Litoricolaceae bacterium]|nr:TRAP transporter fused permease subunit [Litorivicinaceae bacterium]
MRTFLRLVFSITAVGFGVYACAKYESILFTIGFITTDKVVLSLIGIFLLLEALRRSTGYVLVFLCASIFIVPLFVAWISDGVWIRPINWDRVITLVFFGQGGVHGIPAQVAATVVAVFVIFGRCLIQNGGSAAISDISSRVVGQSGADRLAIIASGLFGSLSGSASANVATTGVMTIPLMTAQGIPAFRAAAIEAVASTGGLILPPIMAATGFLIAEYLAIPYAEVAAAALIPALLFYGSIFLYVSIVNPAIGEGSEAGPKPTKKASLFLSSLPFSVPIICLVLLLFFFYQSAPASALIAALSAIIVGILAGHIQKISVLREIVAGSAPQIAEITIICGCAGIIMGVLGVTGIGANLSRLIVSVADGSLPVLILVSACACIVLGMGVPVTATYVILIGLVAPALVSFGVPELSAHLFVFYFGTLSFLTPPVCLSVFVASNLARSGIMPTAIESLKIATPAYLLPVLFLYQPALIGQGDWLTILHVSFLAAIGIGGTTVILAGGLSSSLGTTPNLSNGRRFIALIAALGGFTLLFSV